MRVKTINEGLAKIRVGNEIFYNPRMKICRSISSLWVGSLPKIEILIDGFCASGIRGIRYKLENENVGKVIFVDRSKNACKNALQNAKLSKIKKNKYEIFNSSINKYFIENPAFDFAEIDPFGTPVPYLDALFSADGRRKEGYISITATDAAVLCGAHAKACLNGYGAHPLDNEFCHENGLRIMIGKIARVAAQYDWALEPQICFSHRHYFKVLAKIVKGAKEAHESAKNAFGFAEYCPNCLHHSIAEEFPNEKCPVCENKMKFAGPLWGGKWAEKNVAQKMIELLAGRKYLQDDAREISQFLQKIIDECEGEALYFDLHEIASKYKCKIPQSEELILKLRKEGYFASRTHFKDTGLRTDAPIKAIVKIMRETR